MSRWIILAIDMIVAFISFALATLIRFNFELTQIDFSQLWAQCGIVVILRGVIFYLTETHRGIVRHTSMADALLILKSISISSIILLMISGIARITNFAVINIPVSVIIIDFLILLVAMILTRLTVKFVYDYILRMIHPNQNKVIIYGAGLLGILVKNTLLRNKNSYTKILCFIDNNPQKIGKTIEGIKILSQEDAFAKYFSSPKSFNEIDVVFAIRSIPQKDKNRLLEKLLDLGLNLKDVAPAEQWVNGELSESQIEKIKIEDLLNRSKIELVNEKVESYFKAKTAFITGAAGSIGSEIVRQLLHLSPEVLVLIDQSESLLYDLETELKRLPNGPAKNMRIHAEVCNVTDTQHVESLFKYYVPDIVFHAAAYKHVPLMEKNPFKAFEVNVMGTKCVADLASKYKTKKFVMISTDKAVNPANVMGASKRMAEIYVQSLNKVAGNNTEFIVTRFGNVLGSNGSVVPLFKKQIEKGGPVTVTHPEIIRYFMTIPEACQLVLEAGIMGSGGEIFVFDMGEPVKILDLAKRMIVLSGLQPGKDIEIKFTGLREGEKLYEELLTTGENELPTHHPKIKIAKTVTYDHCTINKELIYFKETVSQSNRMEIVRFLKRQIPEYISNNSIFETLDQ